MMIPGAALDELETAEVAIMGHVSTISAMPLDSDDDEGPDALPMLLAVLRAIATARGLITAQKMIEEMTDPHVGRVGFCHSCGHELGS